MGTDVVITAEGLGKRYLINHVEHSRRYIALRDVVSQSLRGAVRSAGEIVRGRRTTANSDVEELWALRDINFKIRRGEVVGVIGRNGAGKSTLLKILSRITEPSEGRVELRGRVASLLEVGTGFHPELTGRENIFLNGAILGMQRAEVRAKFDEIVGFAELENFLDTPVKRYSTGMYMRLAFAVAAHLEPNVLVVDEVLAVGDAEFQKKCLGKMKDVSRAGRTVLFVSHNMNAVEAMCSRAITLEKGKIRHSGSDVRGVIRRYLAGAPLDGAIAEWRSDGNHLDHPAMKPLYLAVVANDQRPLSTPVRNDEQIYVIIRAKVLQLDPALNMGFALFDQDGRELLWSLTTDGPEEEWPRLEKGQLEMRCALPKRLLNEGSYRVELIASLHHRDWFVRPGHNSPSVGFEIQGGLSDSPYWLYARPGIFAPEWKWERTA